MKKSLSKLLFLNALFIFSLSVKAVKPTEGEHYTINDPAGTSDTPLVTEFFSYTCGHCYNMERVLTDWKKTKDEAIVFERVPVFKPMLTQAYYTAEYLDVADKVHSIIFHKYHAEKKPVRNIADLRAIFAEAGIDNKAFDKAYRSFSVKSRTKKAEKLAKKFRITSVPTFIVNNKYETSGSSAGTTEMLKNILSTLPTTSDDASAKAK